MYIDIQQACKTFQSGSDDTIEALKDITLSVSQGEFISLIGPSGCGKSTLLKMIAGIERPDQGTVCFEGKEVSDLSPERGYIFQDYALFPWLTVRQNIQFGLRHKGKSRKEQKLIAEEYIEKFKLTGADHLFPYQLSGGMKQRTAIARALCLKPGLLLMDEPFAALDTILRYKLQEELLRIWGLEQVTVLMVTHDIEESIYLSDRIIVMSSRPGFVKKELSIPLERPRMRTEPEFMRLREQLTQLLREEIEV
ncbi:ABC transporter ATP-binding protein [Paenibacillus lemnae]|uniref:ABC transporter ATP-binding protein n=1 Tax=Paenibacillus lemnae TaxID=1330551 RepID=A0A848MD99_PAELE|nr:ABC transporter ATP-binding protein [Paenibacillus lemnae]NMO98219.1 ABC transporter ATP-binding protein [Paenibacillus lemnae]